MERGKSKKKEGRKSLGALIVYKKPKKVGKLKCREGEKKRALVAESYGKKRERFGLF